MLQHDEHMEKKTLHIFRAGRHISSDGGSIFFSETDLQDAATCYEPSISEAPIVIGHPSTDAPAYGWVKRLVASADGLQAEVDQLDNKFIALVKAGKFKKISASFYPPASPQNPVPGKYYLRHVGFLGAQPPAVKGLEQVAFSENDQFVTIESEHTMETTSKLDQIIQMLKNFMKNQLPESDQTVKASDKTELAENMPPEKKGNLTQKSQKEGKLDPIAELEEKNRLLEEENAQLKAELDALKQEMNKNEAESFAEMLIAEGKILPRSRQTVVEVMSALNKMAPVNFSDGQQVSLADAYRTMLKSSPTKFPQAQEIVLKTHAATGLCAKFSEKSHPERAMLHEQTVALAQAKNIPYEQAARKLAKT